LILGSIGFFLGPVVLAIAAAAIFDDNRSLQLVAGSGSLLIGMAGAWVVGRVLGFSRESPP